MNKFKGETCQVCGTEFEKKDDVVVCPECGAPYHKNCYSEKGQCVFEENHGKEGCYQSKKAQAEVVCANCGKHNLKGADVCEFCDKKLISKELAVTGRILNNIDLVIRPDMAKGDAAEDKLVEEFVANNAKYFKEAFSGGHRFNFGAFICPIFYYFYRKMYAVGCAFFMALMTLVYIVSRQAKNIYLIIESRFLPLGLSADEILEHIKKIVSQEGHLPEGLQRSAGIVWAAVLMILMVMIFSGFVANRIYRNYVYNKINRCREISREHYQKLILIVGGVSPGSAILAVFSFIVCVLSI